MKTYELLRLVEIAEAAKDHGLYVIANAAFAVLAESANGDVFVKYESEDWSGEHPQETYYGLLHVCVVDNVHGEFVGTCIPVPMLKGEVAAHLTKIAMTTGGFAPRREHNRDTDNCYHPEWPESLWQEIFEIVPRAEVVRACHDTYIYPPEI